MGIFVSRTIWVQDDLLIAGCIACTKSKTTNHTIGRNLNCQSCKGRKGEKRKEYAPKWEILGLLKRIPKGTHYSVRYTLDEQGPFLAVLKTMMVLINVKTKEYMSACFIPKSWDGKRVRRNINTPIYENNRNSVV
jgi:hypothetical protein